MYDGMGRSSPPGVVPLGSSPPLPPGFMSVNDPGSPYGNSQYSNSQYGSQYGGSTYGGSPTSPNDGMVYMQHYMPGACDWTRSTLALKMSQVINISSGIETCNNDDVSTLRSSRFQRDMPVDVVPDFTHTGMVPVGVPVYARGGYPNGTGSLRSYGSCGDMRATARMARSHRWVVSTIHSLD